MDVHTLSRAAATTPTTAVPAAGRRDQIVTLALSIWLIAGLLVDAGAHGRGLADSFFTPWHAVLYSAYLAVAGWMARPIARALAAGQRVTVSLPAGFAPGVWGVVVFAIGGVGDAVWHTVFGFETGIDVPFSPPHFLLILGMVLIVSTPFREAWAAVDPTPDAPSLRDLSPAIVSIALAVTVVALILFPLWGLGAPHYLEPSAQAWIIQTFGLSPEGTGVAREMLRQRAISNILFTTVLLCGSMLIVLRRWRTPFGTFALLFGLTGTLMSSILPFYPVLLPVPALAGLAADALAARLAPAPTSVVSTRWLATLVPVMLWNLYFVGVALTWGNLWPPLLWIGVSLWVGAAGFALSLVAMPSALPGRPV